MFEEKVQRENFRKIEKEKEKIDRAAEIQKIKDMYNREIKQLKEKYEKSRYLKNDLSIQCLNQTFFGPNVV